MAAAATLNTVTQEIKEGNSENTRWHDEERSRQAASDAILATSSAVTGGWLGKIFGGQSAARKDAAEAAREAARKTGGGAGGGGSGFGAGLTAGKGGILGKGLKGLFSIFGMLIKGPFKMLGWIARIPMMLASVTAFWVGLAAIVGFFAAVTIASVTMGQKDFDALKEKIAKGVGHAIAETVGKAMEIWNKFTPDSWNIDPKTAKKFKSATFTAVSETITSVIEFAEKIGKAFHAGFAAELDGFSESWKGFKEVFDKIVKVFEGAMGGAGEKAEAGLLVAAKALGGYIVKIGKFFLDLFAAVGAEALGEDAKTDNTTINTAAGIIVGIIKFIGNIVKSFGAGFAETFKGISEKFGTLKDKLVKVATRIGKLFESVGEGAAENETTIMGVFNMMGKGLGKLIEGILSVANFLADLIIDPTVTLAKAQVAIEDAFNSMGRNIADFLDSIFNKESMLKMMQALLGKDSLMMAGIEKIWGTVEDAAAEREKEMESSKDDMMRRNALMAKSSKETERQLKEALKKEHGMRTEEENTKVKNLQLALSREKAEMERNESGIKRLEENIAASKELIVQEKVDEIMGKKARAQEAKNAKLKKEIADMEGEGGWTGTGKGRKLQKGMTALQEDRVKGAFGDFSLKQFEEMQEVLKAAGLSAKDMTKKGAKLDQDTIEQLFRQFNFKKDDLKDRPQHIFRAGFARLAEIEKRKTDIETKKTQLAETDIALMKQRKETEKTVRLEVEKSHTGSILETSGIIAAQKGQVIIDDILVAGMMKSAQVITGLNLMNLQRASLAGQAAGSSAVTVVNNSSQQINQSRPMILPPSPIIPGNGGSTLAGT